MKKLCGHCGAALHEWVQPMSSWMPPVRIKLPVPDNWRFGRGWGIGKIEGRDAYTNGHFMLAGNPPDGDAVLTGEQPNFQQVVDTCLREGVAQAVCAVAFGQSNGLSIVWFDSGSAVHGDYFAHILSRYPQAQFRAAGIYAPHFIFSSGALVGILMPLDASRLKITPEQALAIGQAKT